MRNIISARLAGNVLLMAFALLAVFHILVIRQVLPSDFIWGGIADDSPGFVLALESVALAVTILFGLIIAAKMDYILAGKCRKTIGVGVWIIFVFMALNVLGNVSSSASLETWVFGPISIIMALCALRLAVEK